MSRVRPGKRTRRSDVGTPPGSVVTTDATRPTTIQVLAYHSEGVEEQTFELSPGEPLPTVPPEPSNGVRWINVIGVHDGGLLQQIGKLHGMHPLQIEDVQNTDQRPTLSASTDAVFGVVRMISWNRGLREPDNEQVSLFSHARTVISFQEKPGDVFDEIRERIRTGRGRVRRSGADYLFYVLIDAVVDSLFMVMDQLQVQVEDLEERIVTDQTQAPLQEIHQTRGQVISTRRSLWPLREMLQRAARGDYSFFDQTTLPFLTDAYEHTLSLVDMVDSQMDRVTGLFQLHAAMVGASTNEVMRVLTIIATIFIPLTFVVGIYGMNFAHMPELQWQYGYPVVIGVMVLVAVGMVVYFKRRKWF